MLRIVPSHYPQFLDARCFELCEDGAVALDLGRARRTGSLIIPFYEVCPNYLIDNISKNFPQMPLHRIDVNLKVALDFEGDSGSLSIGDIVNSNIDLIRIYTRNPDDHYRNFVVVFSRTVLCVFGDDESWIISDHPESEEFLYKLRDIIETSRQNCFAAGVNDRFQPFFADLI